MVITYDPNYGLSPNRTLLELLSLNFAPLRTSPFLRNYWSFDGSYWWMNSGEEQVLPQSVREKYLYGSPVHIGADVSESTNKRSAESAKSGLELGPNVDVHIDLFPTNLAIRPFHELAQKFQNSETPSASSKSLEMAGLLKEGFLFTDGTVKRLARPQVLSARKTVSTKQKSK